MPPPRPAVVPLLAPGAVGDAGAGANHLVVVTLVVLVVPPPPVLMPLVLCRQ
jgi:hypothetical protein